MGIIELLVAANVLTLICYWIGRFRGGGRGRSGALFLGLVSFFIVSLVAVVAREFARDQEYLIRHQVRREMMFAALREARRGLMQIAVAQDAYRAKAGAYAPMQEIVASEILPEGWAESLDTGSLVRGLYVYRLVVTDSTQGGAERWWCYAEPNRSFSVWDIWLPEEVLFADSTGVILVGQSTKYPALRSRGPTGEAGLEGNYDTEHWYKWEDLVTAYKKGWWPTY